MNKKLETLIIHDGYLHIFCACPIYNSHMQLVPQAHTIILLQ